ncbi:hypothetical protein C8Q77DRAFT_319414 [Trametes polyzona]|nr:hypothetical protein C8Q77DRAFT_319414 [Trametes polyzona]
METGTGTGSGSVSLASNTTGEGHGDTICTAIASREKRRQRDREIGMRPWRWAENTDETGWRECAHESLMIRGGVADERKRVLHGDTSGGKQDERAQNGEWHKVRSPVEHASVLDT